MDVLSDILLSRDILLSKALEATESKATESEATESEATESVKRMPRGRPRHFEYKTKQEYHKSYYILHKHKWNMDYQCPSCELVCSYVNKGRHEKSSYHLRIVEQKKAVGTNITQ